jgi:hypothetical protein
MIKVDEWKGGLMMCNFCISREPATIIISSKHDMRRLNVYACSKCENDLRVGLIEIYNDRRHWSNEQGRQ